MIKEICALLTISPELTIREVGAGASFLEKIDVDAPVA